MSSLHKVITNIYILTIIFLKIYKLTNYSINPVLKFSDTLKVDHLEDLCPMLFNTSKSSYLFLTQIFTHGKSTLNMTLNYKKQNPQQKTVIYFSKYYYLLLSKPLIKPISTFNLFKIYNFRTVQNIQPQSRFNQTWCRE